MKSRFFNQSVVFFCFTLILLGCKPKEESKIQVSTLLETSKSWNGAALPNYPEGKPKITVLKVRIPSKAKLEIHKHSVINAAVILSGELMVITELHDTLIARKGEAFSEVVDTWHFGVNNGSTPVELAVFYAGTDGIQYTILKQR